MKIRSLFTQIGFKIDQGPLNKLNRTIDMTKIGIFGLVTAFNTVAVAATKSSLTKLASFEQTEMALEVLIGNVDRAQKLINNLFVHTRKTPFKFEELLESARVMKAVGVETDYLLNRLEVLGDIAAGVPGLTLSNLAYYYGKVKARTFLTGEVERRLSFLAVPIREYLAKAMGVNVKDVSQLMRQQKVSFEYFKKALEMMREKGGLYYNMQIKQAKTYLGVLSIIHDMIYQKIIKGGRPLLDQFKKMVKHFKAWFEINEKIISLKVADYYKTLVGLIDKMWHSSRQTIHNLNLMLEPLGGLEGTLKKISGILLVLTGATLLAGLGYLVVGMTKLAGTWKWLLVGIGKLGLLIALEDIVAFWQERKSVLGNLLDFLNKKFPDSFAPARTVIKGLKEDFADLKTEIMKFWDWIKSSKIGQWLGLSPKTTIKTTDWSKLFDGQSQLTRQEQINKKVEGWINSVTNTIDSLIPKMPVLKYGLAGNMNFPQTQDWGPRLGKIDNVNMTVNVTEPGATSKEIGEAVINEFNMQLRHTFDTVKGNQK